MATKKIMALGTSAAALALVTGLGLSGVASAADSSGAASDTPAGTTQSAPSERGGHGGHRGGGGEMASGLAEKLGVDESKLSDALDTFREANKPTERTEGAEKPERSQRDGALAKSLAESLGIEESKVTTALEELRAADQTERAAALKSKLDTAVDDGTLTQAETDAVTKAIEKGVIGRH
jgi:hypothetical protein